MELKIQCSGYEINTDWLEGADKSKILIVLPGYSSSKARQNAHATAMVQSTGTNALVVDFSGHGTSPFQLRDTRPAQHFLELIYVFDWLKEQYPTAEISLSGSSYGGFLAVQLTKYRKFKNLVLRAPAIYKPAAFYDPWSIRIDNQDAYDEEIVKYRKSSGDLAKHPLLARASSFNGNTLVVVHEKDEIVPRETTDAYIHAFNADSMVAKGFAHSVDKNNPDQATLTMYTDRISHWLNKH
ncbi:alpha/beta hydrolase [Candidatus Saccharibacteria bacterium]|nr:alpha/beta hydrolase [Candidatus Saccharibacteria bacterium]